MTTIKLLTKLRESLPAQEACWVSSALSTDPLVWACLPHIQLSDDGLEFEPGNYKKWSPARMALRTLNGSTTPEDLTPDLTKPPEIDLLQMSLKYFSETRRLSRAPKTIAEAGLLAISLRQHWRLANTWKGLLNQLTSDGSEPDANCIGVWSSAIACLYGMVPDPVEMLRSLFSRRPPMISYSLVTHAVLSNPLSETEQTQVFFNLIIGLAPLQQIGWLRFLKFKGKDSLVEELSHLILGKISASNASSLAEFNPDDCDLETLLLKTVELQRMAGLYRYANQTANSQTMLEKAQLSLRHWAAGLDLQLADISTINNLPDVADQYIRNSLTSLDTATHLQQEVMLQLGGPQTEDLFSKFPQASSHPIVQIYQAGALARDRKLNLATTMARQGVQQWMDQTAQLGEVSLPNFAFDWRPRTAIQILLDLGLIPEALQVIESFLVLRPADRELMELGSIVWEQQGNIEKALAHCDVLATLQADNPEQHRHLAMLLARKEDWQLAFEERLKVINLANPPEIDDWINYAIAASHLAKWNEVLDYANLALQVQADNGLAYALLGQANMEIGNIDEAAKLLTQATLLAPEEALGWLILAELHEKNGDAEKSLEDLRAAVLSVPESADINFKLARICLRQGLLSDGLPFLRKAATLSPESLEVSLGLGQTLLSLGRLDEAYKVLDQAHAKWPSHPELAFAFAQAALAAGDHHGAVLGLQMALKKEDPAPEWQILYAETLMGKDPCTQVKAGDDGIRLADAEHAIDKALEKLPDHLEARILKAEILLAKGSLDQAHELYCQLLDTPEANSPAVRWRLQAGLGSVSLRMGHAESALASLQEASQNQPQNIGLQHLLAEAFKAGNLVNDALATARNALKLAPDDLDNLSWFAGIMLLLGEPLEAVHALNVATQLCPDQPSYWMRMIELCIKLDDEKTARMTLEKLLEIAPLSEDVLRQAATVYLQLRDSENAIYCLKRAVDENELPTKMILVELAYLLWSEKNYVQGLEIIQKAIELDPDDGTQYVFQADFLTQLERYEAAIACLEHGLNLSIPASGINVEFWKTLQSSAFISPDWVTSICDLTQIHARFAHLYRRTGSLAAAFQHAEAAFETNFASPKLAVMAVDYAYAMNLPDQAARLAKDFDFPSISGVSLSAENREALVSLLAVHAGLNMNEDEIDQAQECIEKGFEIDPQNARLEAAYATLLVFQGNWQKADEAYHKALELATLSQSESKQEYHFPTYWLGIAAIETQHSADAIQFFKEAINQFPNEPLAHFGLGRALTEAAERKRLFAEIQCVHWLSGEDWLLDDRYEEFEKALQNAIRLGNTPDIEVWRLRGRAAFRPTTQNLRALAGLMPDAEIGEVLVAALRRAENTAGAIQVGEQFPNHPGVQTQVALTHLYIESAEGLNIARLAVEKRPNNVLGWITLAMLAKKFDQLPDSYMALNRAISFWPDEPVWQSWVAELAAILEIKQECINHWEIASSLRPDHFPYAVALGAAYLQNNQPYQAIAALEKASHLNPNRADLWYMLAQAYKQTGQLNVAIQCAEKSGKLEPDSAQPLLLGGEIHLAMGEKEEALQCALLAWKRDPANEANLLFYVKVLVNLDKADEALAVLDQYKGGLSSEAVDIQRARLVLNLRGPLAALPHLQTLASANPGNIEILALMASAQADCGDLIAAAKTVEEALAIDPTHPELNYLMGKLQHGEGQLDHAVHFLSIALQNDPMLVEAYLELARTYQERREPEEALQIYQAATKVAPGDYRAFYNAALMLRDGKDYVAAETLLRKSAELAPDDVNIRRQLGAVITLNLIHNSQEASTAHESYWTQDIRR